MSGPKKEFEAVLIIPVSAEMKDELRRKTGRLQMATIVRELISEWLKTHTEEKEQANG